MVFLTGDGSLSGFMTENRPLSDFMTENRPLSDFFMDDDGIPIAIGSFPGNTLDHLTLRPAMKKTIDDMDFSRFILIADRGICNYMNLLHTD